MAVRLSPVAGLAEKAGAQFAERRGWREVVSYSQVAAEAVIELNGAAIADESANGKLLLEGAEAASVLQLALGRIPSALTAGVEASAGYPANPTGGLRTASTPAPYTESGTALEGEPPPLGNGSPIDGGSAYRLRPDLFFLSLPPSEERQMLEKLEAAARRSGHFVTATDITDGRFEFRLIGPDARELLGRFCALDFHPDSFPNHGARQTLVAKVPALVIRRDLGGLPAFSLIGARSLGAYLWEVLVHGGRPPVE